MSDSPKVRPSVVRAHPSAVDAKRQRSGVAPTTDALLEKHGEVARTRGQAAVDELDRLLVDIREGRIVRDLRAIYAAAEEVVAGGVNSAAVERLLAAVCTRSGEPRAGPVEHGVLGNPDDLNGLGSLMQRTLGLPDPSTQSMVDHVRTVLNQLQRFGDFNRWPLPSLPPHKFALMLVLHDIGKPLAAEGLDKNRQHDFSVPLLQSLLPALGFSDQESRLALAILAEDPIGGFLQEKLELDQANGQVRYLARLAGVEATELFRGIELFYKLDASSYTKSATQAVGSHWVGHPEAARYESPIERFNVFESGTDPTQNTLSLGTATGEKVRTLAQAVAARLSSQRLMFTATGAELYISQHLLELDGAAVQAAIAQALVDEFGTIAHHLLSDSELLTVLDTLEELTQSRLPPAARERAFQSPRAVLDLRNLLYRYLDPRESDAAKLSNLALGVRALLRGGVYNATPTTREIAEAGQRLARVRDFDARDRMHAEMVSTLNANLGGRLLGLSAERTGRLQRALLEATVSSGAHYRGITEEAATQQRAARKSGAERTAPAEPSADARVAATPELLARADALRALGVDVNPATGTLPYGQVHGLAELETVLHLQAVFQAAELDLRVEDFLSQLAALPPEQLVSRVERVGRTLAENVGDAEQVLYSDDPRELVLLQGLALLLLVSNSTWMHGQVHRAFLGAVDRVDPDRRGGVYTSYETLCRQRLEQEGLGDPVQVAQAIDDGGRSHLDYDRVSALPPSLLSELLKSVVPAFRFASLVTG